MTSTQLILLVITRVLIGWHFLYEGVSKMANPNWSAYAYLIDSKGPLESFFLFFVSSPALVKVIDLLNIYGLTLIGIGLIAGLFTRVSLISGMVLLAFYYLSQPPLPLLSYSMPAEGSYLIVNKTLIELFSMAVLLVFPTWHRIGMDRFLRRKNKR
jgi:thiosulfate dehydrogenase (quinone) large subunit